MTATKTTATRLTHVPALRRVQNPRFDDWVTLGYEELGQCEILAEYSWGHMTRDGQGVDGSDGGIIVRMNGEVKKAYLSRRDNGEYVAVLMPAKNREWHILPSETQFENRLFDMVLSMKEGQKKKTRQLDGGLYRVERHTHPTSESKIVLGLR